VADAIHENQKNADGKSEKVLHPCLIQIINQARNQLGTPGGAKCFLWGAKIFWTMFNIFKLYPTHFSRRRRNFFSKWYRASKQNITLFTYTT